MVWTERRRSVSLRSSSSFPRSLLHLATTSWILPRYPHFLPPSLPPSLPPAIKLELAKISTSFSNNVLDPTKVPLSLLPPSLPPSLYWSFFSTSEFQCLLLIALPPSLPPFLPPSLRPFLSSSRKSQTWTASPLCSSPSQPFLPPSVPPSLLHSLPPSVPQAFSVVVTEKSDLDGLPTMFFDLFAQNAVQKGHKEATG